MLKRRNSYSEEQRKKKKSEMYLFNFIKWNDEQNSAKIFLNETFFHTVKLFQRFFSVRETGMNLNLMEIVFYIQDSMLCVKMLTKDTHDEFPILNGSPLTVKCDTNFENILNEIHEKNSWLDCSKYCKGDLNLPSNAEILLKSLLVNFFFSNFKAWGITIKNGCIYVDIKIIKTAFEFKLPNMNFPKEPFMLQVGSRSWTLEQISKKLKSEPKNISGKEMSKKTNKATCVERFSDENFFPSESQKEIINYIENVVDYIEDVENNKTIFYLGINSVAGAGKTTLVKFLQEKYKVIYLAPTNLMVSEMTYLPEHQKFTVAKFFMRSLGFSLDFWSSIQDSVSPDNDLDLNSINFEFLSQIFDSEKSVIFFFDEFTLISVNIPNILKNMLKEMKFVACFVGDFNQQENINHYSGKCVKILNKCDSIMFLNEHIRSRECLKLTAFLKKFETGVLKNYSCLKKSNTVNIVELLEKYINENEEFLFLAVSNERKYAYMESIFNVAVAICNVVGVRESKVEKKFQNGDPELSTYLLEGFKYFVVERNVAFSFQQDDGSVIVMSPPKNQIFQIDAIEEDFLVGRFGEQKATLCRTRFRTGATTENAKNFLFYGYPLEMVCVDTIYKSQGRTFEGSMFLDLKDSQVPQMYVALSRAKKLSQITINNK